MLVGVDVLCKGNMLCMGGVLGFKGNVLCMGEYWDLMEMCCV